MKAKDWLLGVRDVYRATFPSKDKQLAEMEYKLKQTQGWLAQSRVAFHNADSERKRQFHRAETLQNELAVCETKGKELENELRGLKKLHGL